MQNITDTLRLHGALHQANLALREGRRGDAHSRDAAINRMYDTLESCDYPTLTTTRLIQHVGRGKAMVLGLARPLINLALKFEA